MSPEPIRVFCQNCRNANSIHDEQCHACGTRLLIFAPHRGRSVDFSLPSENELHLLGKIAALEQKMSEMSDILDIANDLLLARTSELFEVRSAARRKAVADLADRAAVSETVSSKLDKAAVIAEHSGPNSAILAGLLDDAARLLEDGEEREAFRMYERCLLLSPSNTALYFGVGIVYFERERFSDSLRILARLYSISKSLPELPLIQAALSAEIGDLIAARSFLEQTDPNSDLFGASCLIRGLTEIADGALETAEGFLTDANRLLGESAEIGFMIASVRFDRGIRASALEAATRAIELDGNFADALFLTAVIYAGQGEPDRAAEMIAAAASSDLSGAMCSRYLVVGGEFPERSLALEHLRLRKSGILSGLPRRVRGFTETILLAACGRRECAPHV